MFDYGTYREHFQHLGTPREGGTEPHDTTTLDLYHAICDQYGIRSVLEIGFNRGGSALAFLLCGASVTSIDIYDTVESSEYLQQAFRDQFVFVCMDSKDIISDERSVGWHERFDLAYIDGHHGEQYVESDTTQCIQLGIPYLLFDDSHHGSHQNIRTLIDRGVTEQRWEIIGDYPIGCGKTLVKVL